MKIDRPKRGSVGAKRIDLSDIREVLKDQRQWCGIGVVIAPSDGSPHWRIETDDDGTEVDVLVEVVLQPSQIPATCRLAAGMWTVPDLDEEVAVIIPAGRIDFMPIVIAILSSNVVPGGGQGPAPTNIVIARGPGTKVYIHDGTGGAEPLVKRSEFVGHTHKAPTLTGASYAPGTDPTAETGGADDVPGTDVLMAK